jgi:oxygen-independent coproporphyrinogen III oxidase
MHHLYLHVPFCVRRCSYCDFSIAIRKRIPVRDYVAALLSEWRSAEPGPVAPERRAWNGSGLETIYFGGGTPSLLAPEAIRQIVSEIVGSADPGPTARGERGRFEVTLEANPEDVTTENAKAWRAAGVNRVSLGAQSFDDTALKWMHRSHSAARIGAAVHALRGAGIENISLDLIFALPDELGRDWERDLDMALALRPTHLSLYGLTVEPRTPLDRWISRGATQPPDEERYAEEYLFAHRRLAADGLEFYEVSNASRPGFRSKHNSAYWSGKSYVGLGPAAHSFDGRTRRWNVRAWEAYRRAIAEGRSPVESEERLTDEQQRMEVLYLGLRTVEGVSSTILHQPPPSFTAEGWVEMTNGRLKCTPEGWLRLDSVVNEITMQTEIR